MDSRNQTIMFLFLGAVAVLAFFKDSIDWVNLQDHITAFMTAIGGAATMLWTAFQEYRHRTNHGTHLPALKVPSKKKNDE